jgi:hypothetical protein
MVWMQIEMAFKTESQEATQEAGGETLSSHGNNE